MSAHSQQQQQQQQYYPERHLPTQPKRVPVTDSKPVASVAPGQPSAPARVKTKYVSLGTPSSSSDDGGGNATQSHAPPKSLFLDLPYVEDGGGSGGVVKGVINAWCICSSIDLVELQSALETRFGVGRCKTFQEVFFCPYYNDSGQPCGDVFYFDFGVVVCWGLTTGQEFDAVFGILGQCARSPLQDRDVEVDEFEFQFGWNERAHMQNDTISLNIRYAKDILMKAAISLAIAQSTKLCVQEEMAMQMVLDTKDFPFHLAKTGASPVKDEELAQIIGKVCLLKSSVNLLSTVLDIPDFFWGRPDYYEAAYKSVCKYLELDERVEILNSRFQVLMDLLNMLRDHNGHRHAVRLEWIIIILIFISLLLGCFQVASILGVFTRVRRLR